MNSNVVLRDVDEMFDGKQFRSLDSTASPLRRQTSRQHIALRFEGACASCSPATIPTILELNSPRHAEALSMTVANGVSKTTDVLVAYENDSASGKAKKAHAYGVPIVSARQFARAELGDSLDALGTGGSRKVISCPDCHTTWTVDARTAAHTRRQCDDCSSTD